MNTRWRCPPESSLSGTSAIRHRRTPSPQATAASSSGPAAEEAPRGEAPHPHDLGGSQGKDEARRVELTEIGDARAGWPGEPLRGRSEPAERRDEPGDRLEQGGFTGTVRSYESESLALPQR